MRKIGLIAATTAASFSVVGIAQALTTAEITQGLQTKTTGKKGTKAKPSGLTLDITTTTSAKDVSKNGEYATTKAVIHFDKNLKFNNSKFPTCSIAIVSSRPETCPAGSLVGKGSASATAGPEQNVKVNPGIEAYNDKGGKLHLKLIAKPGEFDSQGILTGTLSKDTGKYGNKLTVPIPAKLQNNLGLYITLTRFNTKISNKKYKGFNYATSVGCTGGKYKFGGDFTFIDGPYNPGTDGAFPSPGLNKFGPIKVASTSKC